MLNQNLTPKDASFNSLDAKVLGGVETSIT